MKALISTEAQMLIAVEAIKQPGVKISELADMFHVDATVVRSAKRTYSSDAEKIIDALNKLELFQPRNRRKGDIVVEATKPEPVVEEAESSTGTDDKRGFKGRNGRWKLLNKMFDEVGFDKPSKELLEEANKRSREAGLNELNKSSFYAMLSIAKKAHSQAH